MTLNLHLDPAISEALERLAEARGRTPEEVALEALAAFVKAPTDAPPATSPNFGRFRSGTGDVSVRAEEILRKAGEEGRWP